MDISVAEQILDELLPVLEAIEAQSAAILQFMKEKGMATDEQLAPYFEQAGNASNVRWRAARLRINRVLSSAAKDEENSAKPASAKEEQPASAQTGSQNEAQKSKPEPTEEKTEKVDGRPGAKTVDFNVESSATQKEPEKENEASAGAAKETVTPKEEPGKSVEPTDSKRKDAA